MAEQPRAAPFESTKSGDLLLYVFAKPKASKSRVVGIVEGEFAVRLAAPPVEGAANAELVRLVARVFGLSKGRVILEKGEASRHKTVRLLGVSMEEAERALAQNP